jgi:hypothetical protein
LETARKQLEAGWWRGNRHLAQAIVNRLILVALRNELPAGAAVCAVRSALRSVPEGVVAGLLDSLHELAVLARRGDEVLIFRVQALLRFARGAAGASVARDWAVVTTAYVAASLRPARAEADVAVVENALAAGQLAALPHSSLPGTESEAWKHYWAAVEAGEESTVYYALVRYVRLDNVWRRVVGGGGLSLLLSQHSLDEGPDDSGIGGHVVPAAREAAAEA